MMMDPAHGTIGGEEADQRDVQKNNFADAAAILSRIRSRAASTTIRAPTSSRRATAAPRPPRRPWLGRARQADRHDLDAGRCRAQAPVQRQARRPRRHARSARLRRPADRAWRSHQDGSLRHGRPQALPVHGVLGRGARHRRHRGPGDRDLATSARPGRPSRPCCPVSPG